MSNKFLGLLMVPMVMGSIGMANAELTPVSASQTFNATLAEMMEIEANDAGASLIADINPEDGQLSTALKSSFNVTTNIKDAKVYLSAEVASDSSTESALFKKAGHSFIVLGNVGDEQKPTVDAINDCKNATSTPENNANAIAYQFASVDRPNTVDISYDHDKDVIIYELHEDSATVGITTKTAAAEGTFSRKDTAGSYQAQVTLSSANL